MLDAHTFAIALQSLRRYPLRTALALTGMAIGVGAVLVTVAIGTGAQNAIHDQVRAAGLNVIQVKAGNYRTKGEGGGGVLADHAFLRWLDAWLLPTVHAHPENDPMEKHDHPTAADRLGDSAAGLGGSATLTQADADAIAELPGVANVAPGVHENIRAFAGDRRWFTRLHGTDVDLPLIRRAHGITHGRFFSRGELQRADQVVVLGSIVRDKLFGEDSEPVGETLTLWNQPFRIVGVTESTNWMTPGAAGDDEFDSVYVPFTTVHRLLNITNLNTITITTESAGDVSSVATAIRELLRVRHAIPDIAPDDFTVTTQASEVLARGLHPNVARVLVGNLPNLERTTLQELSMTLERSGRTMTALLAAIAAVSLIVGGIGVTNIMLLSVTERTREIGMRMSVGARARDVGAQFSTEALTLALTGGLVGIMLGVLASWTLSIGFGWATELSIGDGALGFAVAVAIGLIAGILPARRASALNPIDALRYE
jgi:putative ABC transport system permease protein